MIRGFSGLLKFSFNNVRKQINPLQLATMYTQNDATETMKAIAQKREKAIDSADFKEYSSEDVEKILKIVNSNDINGLLNYGITKARAQKLLNYINSNGGFKNLQEMVLIKGFNSKSASKLCKSLLNEPVSIADKKTQIPRITSYVTPNVGVKQRDSIKSCVSVRIGVSSVTWARLEISKATKYLLTHWQHHEILDKKLHINDLVQRCMYVEHLIPAADCYLFENPQMAQASNNPSSNIDQQNISIQKSQIIAILAYALSARNRLALNLTDEQKEISEESNIKESTQTNVFYLRRFLSARLFSHLIGTERVSSEEAVFNILSGCESNKQNDFLVDNEYIMSDNVYKKGVSELRNSVLVSEDLKQMFDEAQRYHREFLGQALLLNLAFLRLVILQDPKSIAAVSRKSSKQSDTIINRS